MTTSELHARVLNLALGRGLATEFQIQAPGPPPTNPEAAWGPKIQILVDRGQLSYDVAQLLLWEASQAGPGGPPSPRPIAPDSWMGSRADESVPEQPEEFEALIWERYTDVKLIAVGGAGMVFRAFDTKLARKVALKVLKRTRPENASRLLDEARAQAGVDHPNVCKIYEVGENQGHPFIAMQLVIGQSLAEAMPELSVREKVSVLMDVAEGVHAAHRRGLVHLDLKPGNVLLEFLDSGEIQAYVSDFGLVKLEGAPGKALGAAEGTPPFASPEQVRGQLDLLDRRSDVYALGVMLYVLLSGRFPFEEQTPEGLVRATLEDPPIPLTMREGMFPKDLQWITRKAMRKNPEERYGSALAFAEDLHRFLDGQVVLARPRTLAYRLRTWIRRHRATSAAVAAGVLLGLVATALGLRAAWWARRQGELAQHYEQIVDRADAVVRQDAMLPPHDVRQARTYFWDQLGAVRSELEQGGPAYAPGHYALGRAELLYGDRGKALEHLEAAWRAGLRSPVVMAALGEAKLHLYFTAKEDADHIQNPQARSQKHAELEAQLRNGGLALLRDVNRNLSGPQGMGVEARLALFEGRWQAALRAAEELKEKHPWLSDGWILEGRAHEISAIQAQEEGKLVVALQALDNAEHALLETTRRFPSAVGPWRLKSEVWRRRAEIQKRLGKDPFPALLKATERLDRCLELDPGHLYDGLYRARLLLAEADYLEETGYDRREVLVALDRLTAREIRKLGVQNGAYLLDLRVKGLLGLSRYEETPADGRAALVSAIDSVQEAIQGNIREKAPHALLVRVLRHFAEFGPVSDTDFSWIMGRAEVAYRAALDLDFRTPARIDMALLLALAAERQGGEDLERARICMADAPRDEDPYLEALAWARMSRIEAEQNPGRKEVLLARAKGFLKSTKPGLEEVPSFRREAKALGFKDPWASKQLESRRRQQPFEDR